MPCAGQGISVKRRLVKTEKKNQASFDLTCNVYKQVEHQIFKPGAQERMVGTV